MNARAANAHAENDCGCEQNAHSRNCCYFFSSPLGLPLGFPPDFAPGLPPFS